MASDSEWLISVDPASRTVRLTGRLDAVNSDAVYEALATITDPRPEVNLDLSGVTSCTGAFFKCLLDAKSRLEQLGSGLAITSVSAEVGQLLARHDAAALGFVEA